MKCNHKKWLFLPMRCFLFLTAFSFCSIITRRKLTEITHWWTILASAANIVTIIVLWMICKRQGITYCEMIHYNYNRKQGNIFRGFVFIVIMISMGMAGMYAAGVLCYGRFPYLAPMMTEPAPLYPALLNILVLPITTTIAEDGLYLGYGVNNFSSRWTAVLVPAFFYALQHSFIPTLLDVRFIVYRFLSFFPLTIWICYQYYKGKPVSYIMTGHWILNLATTIQIAIMSLLL